MATPEYIQIAGAPSPLPVAWLEGDVLAEYLQFLEEAAAKAAPLPRVKWLEGDVLANFLQFLREDETVVHYDSTSSSSGSNGGDFMDEEEDDEEEEMAFLLQHITSLPAVMARVAAAAATSVQD